MLDTNARASQESAMPIGAWLTALRPDCYERNAFRVTELPVNAGARDIQRRQQLIEMAVKTGASLPPGAARLLPVDAARDPEAVREAVQRLRDPEQRLVEELFWFWAQDGNYAEDPALAALAGDDWQAAEALWRAQVDRPGGHIAAHNVAVLTHGAALGWERQSARVDAAQRDRAWQTAFTAWRALLNNEPFWSALTARIREMDDPRLTTGTARRLREALPAALLGINARLALSAAESGDRTEAERLVRIIWSAGFEDAAAKTALTAVVQPPRERLSTLCRATESQINGAPEKGAVVASRLLDQSAPLLAVLHHLLGADHATRVAACDEVAQAALTCVIAFGNKTEDWAATEPLVERLLAVAASSSIRSRLQSTLETLRGNIEYQQEFGQCWFCKREKSTDGAAIPIKMYGDVTRTPTRNGTQVEWRQRTIDVPRCAACRQVHRRTSNWAHAYLWSGLATAIIGGVAVNEAFTAATGTPVEYYGPLDWLLLAPIAVALALWLIPFAVGQLPSGWKWMLSITVGICGLFATFAMIEQTQGKGYEGGLNMLMLVPILLAATAWLIPVLRERRSGRTNDGPLPVSARKSFPAVQRQLREGWSFGERPTT